MFEFLSFAWEIAKGLWWVPVVFAAAGIILFVAGWAGWFDKTGYLGDKEQ